MVKVEWWAGGVVSGVLFAEGSLDHYHGLEVRL